MKILQQTIFQVHTARFLITAMGEKLIVSRKGGAMIDDYNMDTDSVDYVVDDLVMMFIELCTCDITTDDEVLELTETVYTFVNAFYLNRANRMAKNQNK